MLDDQNSWMAKNGFEKKMKAVGILEGVFKKVFTRACVEQRCVCYRVALCGLVNV